jgi:hypothetical protein
MFLRPLALHLLLCSSALAQLTWERTEIATHATPGDKVVVAAFGFTNSGSSPIRIEKTVSQCDCTTAESGGKEVAPGQKGEILVRFAVGGRVGLQRKTIDVFTDSAGREKTTLALSVRIDPAVQVSPAVLWWRVGGEKKTQTLRITVPESAPLNFTGAQCSDARWRVELKTLSPGRDYTVEATPLDTATAAAGLVTLELNMDNPPQNAPVVTARLRIQ